MFCSCSLVLKLSSWLCRLESIAITGKLVEQKHEAISYVWGSPPFSEQILYNDRVVKISSSLEQALKHPHLADTKRVLGIPRGRP